MKADGFELTREQFVSLIEKYAQMGGGSQALSIFENDFLKYVEISQKNTLLLILFINIDTVC